jgi:hypothetical protein
MLDHVLGRFPFLATREVGVAAALTWESVMGAEISSTQGGDPSSYLYSNAILPGALN